MDGIQNRNLNTDLSTLGKSSPASAPSSQSRSDAEKFQMELEKDNLPSKKNFPKDAEARPRPKSDDNLPSPSRSGSNASNKSQGASPRDNASDNNRESDEVGLEKLPNKEDSPVKKTEKASPATRSALVKIAAQMKQSGEDPQTASPVLGVLSGKNPSVALEDIPALVTSSPFVMQALGTDISQYLSTPQTIEALATNLDLDDVVLDRALTMGIDPMVKVSPREFLMALGIDPQKITAELVKIRDRGPIEGLGSLIHSFKKMGETQKDQTNDIPVAMGTTPIKTRDDLVKLSKMGSELTAGRLGGISNQGRDGLKADGINGDQNFLTSLIDDAFSRNQHLESLGKKSGSDPDVGSSTGGMADFIFSNAEKTSKDPFDLMANQITDVQTIDLNAIRENSLAIGERENFLSREINFSDLDSRDISSELYRLGIENNKNGPDFVGSLESTEGSQSASGLLTGGLAAISASNADTKNFDDRSEGEGSNDGSKQNDHLPLSHRDSMIGSSKNQVGADFLSVSDASSMSSSEKIANIRDIFDKAQLLVSQGGGSMKIDIGGSSPVSLAIKVMEGEVSLKIATDNDRMRDLIASELPKLQESMASQNLKLSQVDLGRNLSSSARDGQSGRDLSQQFQFQQQNQRQPQNSGESLASALRRPVGQRPVEVTSLERMARPRAGIVSNNLGKLLVRV